MQTQAGVPQPYSPPDLAVLRIEVERLTKSMDKDKNFQGYSEKIKSIFKNNPNAVEELREWVFDRMDPVAVQQSPEIRKSIQQFLQIFPKANTSVTIGNREFHTLLLGSVSRTLDYAGGGAEEEKTIENDALQENLHGFVENGEKINITDDNILKILEFADKSESQELIDACIEHFDRTENFLLNLPNQQKAALLDFATTHHQGWLQIRILTAPGFVEDNFILEKFKRERPQLHELCKIFALPTLTGLGYVGSQVQMHIFSENELTHLTELLAHQLHFNEIILSTNDLNVIQGTCDLLDYSTDIRSFELDPPISSPNVHEQLNIVADMIKTNNTLTSLKVTDFIATDQDIQNLASALRENNTLLVLNFSNLLLSEVNVGPLAEALVQNNKIERLEFANSYLTVDGAKNILAILPKLSNLSHLNLSGHNLGLEATIFLAAVLKGHSRIATLDLSYNDINDEAVTQLSQMLQTNRSLSTLILKNNQITQAGIKMLADALAINRTLRILNLDLNQFGPEGAKHLSFALQNNDAIQELSLALALIQNEGASYLEQALRMNHSLRTLSLEENDIEPESIIKLFEALKNNDTLTRLNITNNLVHEDDIEPVNALNTNPNLKVLWDEVTLFG